MLQFLSLRGGSQLELEKRVSFFVFCLWHGERERGGRERVILLSNVSFPESGPPTRSIRRGLVISSVLAMVGGRWGEEGGGVGWSFLQGLVRVRDLYSVLCNTFSSDKT